jgi:hypothetical protein
MEYQSSPIKWCEALYQHSDYIAEFWNTLSSMSFTIISFYGYYKHKDYNFSKKNISNKLWFLFGIIGPTSMIFHTTLSFFGQFIDEVSILIFLFYCMKIIYKLSNVTYIIYTISTILITYFLPFISPFILITLGYFLTNSTKDILSYCNDSKHLWNRGYAYGIFSIFLWIFDWICIINTHSWWHIFISISVYHFILVMIKELSYGSQGADKIKIIYKTIPCLEE